MKFLRILHILLLLLICNSLWSQSKFDIKGRVIDKETNEMVEGATVRLLSLPDSSFVKGEVTNELGSFTISGIKKKGKYALNVSFIGYTPVFHAVDLNGQKLKTLDLGTLALLDGNKQLNELVVSANAAKVQVSGDSFACAITAAPHSLP